METSVRRLVVTICGASGAGKSLLAKAVVARLGESLSARVPTDYFLVPAAEPLSEYFRQPLAYDWATLKRTLAAPLGTLVTTPRFDFERFQRTAEAERRSFTVRPVMVIDAMYPCPWADISILIETPASVRRARIAERDNVWGSNVAGRWEQLERSRERLDRLATAYYDMRLAGEAALERNAAAVITLLQ